MLNKEEKEKIIKDNQSHPKDKGSSKIQSALLTANIKKLVGHFKAHPKDKHSQRGLIRMIENRKKQEKYLARKTK